MLVPRRAARVPRPNHEGAPMTNDTRGVLYLNGKVERIPEAKWPELKERSGIR